MNKVWLIVAFLLAAPLLLSDPGQAAPLGSSVPPALEATSLVEKAACVRRRVCGPRGCAWRTVCGRRW